MGLWLAAAASLYADVRLRYRSDFKFNRSLPEAMSRMAMKSLGTAMPREIVIRLKNGKGFSSWGNYTTITDFSKKEATLVDSDGKRYATLPLDRFSEEVGGAMPELPAEAKAGLSGFKGRFESRSTGRTATIRGIEAEERELVMTVDMPGAADAATPMMKLTMQVWTAKAAEAARVPAVREISGYKLWSNAMMNPAAAMEKMLKQLPGFGDNVAAMMKELKAGSAVLLRTHTDVYMPMLGTMLQAMPAGSQSPFGPDFDPAAPLAQMNQEAVEISTDAVPDSVFVLPEGFQPAPMAEIMKGLFSRMSPRQ
jgi:hypothetical protein